MARPASESLTEREAQIMEAIWNAAEPLTAEQIRCALRDPPHDSSVRTLLRVLENKGCVLRETQNRAHCYRAAVPRVVAQRTAVRSLLARFFGGSADALMMRLIEDEAITSEQIEELRNPARKETRKRKPK